MLPLTTVSQSLTVVVPVYNGAATLPALIERLVPVASEPPVPFSGPLRTPSQIVDRVFGYALGRAPSPRERIAATNAVKDMSAGSVADLLWAVLMTPEFQLIR